MMFLGALILPQVVPPFRETFGYSTSQFTKTSVAQWRVMKAIEDAKEAGDTQGLEIECLTEEE